MFSTNSLDDFLLNQHIKHYLYIDEFYSYENKLFYKEQYNERFYVLYFKRYDSKRMSPYSYEFAGYYDCIDKILYNSGYRIDECISNSKLISLSSFNVLRDKIAKEVEHYIKQYCLDNSDDLKKEFIEEFGKQEPYRFDTYRDMVNKNFVLGEIDKNVPLPVFDAKDSYEREFYFDNNLIYTEYLNKPLETVMKIGSWVQKDLRERKDMGFMLLKNEFQNNYLKELLENKSGIFDYLYLNRKILNSIKDFDAVNLNITINYSGKTLTFKYSKDRLVSDLKNCDLGSNGYGKSYEAVDNFLEENKTSNDKWHRNEFDFKNIESITYGKNELYKNEDLKKETLKEHDDYEKEMEEIDI